MGAISGPNRDAPTGAGAAMNDTIVAAPDASEAAQHECRRGGPDGCAGCIVWSLAGIWARSWGA
jgi:hypothetical protein